MTPADVLAAFAAIGPADIAHGDIPEPVRGVRLPVRIAGAWSPASRRLSPDDTLVQASLVPEGGGQEAEVWAIVASGPDLPPHMAPLALSWPAGSAVPILSPRTPADELAAIRMRR